MDMPVNVPVDDPNADTEWNDILRKHKIIPEKPPSPTPIIEEAILEARKREHENRLGGKDLDELDELEDEEDEAFLEAYRKQRLSELSQLQHASVYNQVYPLQKPDYSREVTDASQNAFVFVNLTASLGSNSESRLLSELWRRLAVKYGDIKFCEIRANMCIDGYPERNTPTILVYKDQDIRRQVVTLREFKGPRTDLRDLEDLLVAVGAVRENDSRLRKLEEDKEPGKATHASEDEGDDWD